MTPWTSPWNSPGQNTGLGSLFFLQGIFPTQGLNPGHPHCRRILYQLSHQGSPRILEAQEYPRIVGSLSLLQRIFPTQGLNWSLLHGMWILFQLSYQGTLVFMYFPTICKTYACLYYSQTQCVIVLLFIIIMTVNMFWLLYSYLKNFEAFQIFLTGQHQIKSIKKKNKMKYSICFMILN